MSHLWFDETHPEYDILSPKWEYTQDYYSGEVLDKLDTYLEERKQGETDDAYEERQNIADFTPLLGHVIDSLIGMFSAADEKATRNWYEADDEGEPALDSLGDPKDPDSRAFTVWNDANGDGLNWDTLWKVFSTDIIVNQHMWVLVDGKTDSRPHPVTNLVNPLDVPDFIEDDNGRLVEVKVRDTEYDRSGVDELAEEEDIRIVYRLNGWTKYKKEIVESDKPSEDDKIKITEIDKGAYYYEDRNGQQILPIKRFELPLRRYVGYLLAKKNNAIFNKESAKDFLEWVACFPKLNLFADDDLFESIKEELDDGSNILQNKPDSSHAHDYAAPDVTAAKRLEDSLQKKIEHFLYVAFQQYSDSAREKTATEVKQDLSKGIGAFLELLKGTVDEAENFAFWILEQTYFPAKTAQITEEGVDTEDVPDNQSRDLWGQASVERSSDFMPIDMDQRIKDMKEQVFGMNTVPADVEAQLQVVKRVFEYYDIDVNEDELKKVIEQRQARNSRNSDFESQFEEIVNGA